MGNINGGFDPQAIADELVDKYADDAAQIATEIQRRVPTDPHRQMLERVIRIWGLSATEASLVMGGVSRQAVSQWRDGARPVPVDRRGHLADLAAMTDLLERYVKHERISAVVRRPADDLGGLRLLDLAHDQRTSEGLAYLRDLFDYQQLHA